MLTARNALPEIRLAHRILVVEDYAATADAIKGFLQQKGFEVFIARDGGQAHSQFMMIKPDVVLLDLILPGENGFAICDYIKRSDRNVPVIVMTAIPLEKSRKLASLVGADAYVTKPCDPETLLEHILRISQTRWSERHDAKSPPPADEQRIHFECTCGKKLKARLSLRGRTMLCSNCGKKLIVPLREN